MKAGYVMRAMVVAAMAAGSALADEARLDALEQKVNELAANGSGSGQEIHIGGYGELHYSNPDEGDSEVDQHRLVVGLGYAFTEDVSFHMEIDYEHAAQELELEFAHIDFAVSEPLSVRAGVILMPVGALNDTHEPTLFYSVERPYLQRTVIPTTWQEAGLGIHGRVAGAVSYSAYLVSGLDAHGFSGANGIRGGRVTEDEAVANDFAVVARVAANAAKGLTLGASAYHGNAGQDSHDFDGDAAVTLLEADAVLRVKALELSAAVVQIDVDDTDALNAYFVEEDGRDAEVVGEEILGWNLEAAVHLYTGTPKRFLKDIVAFVRYETFNTQESVVDGFVADPANDREVVTAGVAYYPVGDVAVKLDVEEWSNDADEDWTVVNAGLAFTY